MRPARWLAPAAGLLLIVLLTHSIYTHGLGDVKHTFQARQTLRFVEGERSYAEALAEFRGVFPPLHPTLIFALSRLGLPLPLLNEVLMLGIAGAVFFLLYRHREGDNLSLALVGVLFLTVMQAPYLWGRQLMADTLFTALGLATCVALHLYLKRPGPVPLAALSVAGAALFLTRYLGVFWIAPIVTLHLLLQDGRIARRLRHAATFLVVSMTPLAAWLFRTWVRTGMLTGRDRFGDRPLPPGRMQWLEQTDILTNLHFTGKSFLVDWLSAREWASHQVIGAPASISRVQVAGLLATFGLGVALLTLLIRWMREPRPLSLRGRVLAAYRSSPVFLALEFSAAYLLALVAVWAVGNNDPIYSRYILPTVPFLVLFGFLATARGRHDVASPWIRVSCGAFYAVVFSIQAYKTLLSQ